VERDREETELGVIVCFFFIIQVISSSQALGGVAKINISIAEGTLSRLDPRSMPYEIWADPDLYLQLIVVFSI
jgi:hypothetical protein